MHRHVCCGDLIRILPYKHQQMYNYIFFFFFLSLNLLIGWQLSICICCRTFSSLLDNYQFLCFWRLALSIAVEVVPRPFFRILLLQEFYILCVLVLIFSYIFQHNCHPQGATPILLKRTAIH